MKKLNVLLMSGLLALGLAACANTTDTESKTEVKTDSQTETQTSTKTEEEVVVAPEVLPNSVFGVNVMSGSYTIKGGGDCKLVLKAGYVAEFNITCKQAIPNMTIEQTSAMFSKKGTYEIDAAGDYVFKVDMGRPGAANIQTFTSEYDEETKLHSLVYGLIGPETTINIEMSGNLPLVKGTGNEILNENVMSGSYTIKGGGDCKLVLKENGVAEFNITCKEAIPNMTIEQTSAMFSKKGTYIFFNNEYTFRVDFVDRQGNHNVQFYTAEYDEETSTYSLVYGLIGPEATINIEMTGNFVKPATPAPDAGTEGGQTEGGQAEGGQAEGQAE